MRLHLIIVNKMYSLNCIILGLKFCLLSDQSVFCKKINFLLGPFNVGCYFIIDDYFSLSLNILIVFSSALISGL